MKYSKDGKVKFDESSHTYWLGDKKLTSVTTYISKYKAFFDSDAISEKYARKHGRTKEDVLLEWKQKADASCEMGTFIHAIFEDYILGNEIKTSDDYPKSKVAIKIIDDLFKTNRLTPVETEYIVYNDELAGQIDCIAKNHQNEYFILDWKTNKEIKFDNRWQSMTGRFSHLDDCSFNHYSLQLNTYKSMCKEYNIKSCFIVHLEEDNYKIIPTDEKIL